MKNTLFLSCILYSYFLTGQTIGDQIFDNSFVHEIRIESDDADLIDNLFVDHFSYLFSNTPIPYRPVKVTIDGITLDTIGIRIKGGSSAIDDKKPLKLDFNRFVSGQKYDGLKKLNLHNGNLDKSMQREAIAYSVFKFAGVKCGRYSYAQVFVNDVLQGVYILIEQIDNTFVDHYFASKNGTILKGGEGTVSPVVVVDETGPLDDHTEMINVITNTSPSELKNTLDTIMDTDNFLKYMIVLNLINAVDNAIQNYNFYMYHEDKSSLLYWVPWDQNLSLYPFVNYNLDITGPNSNPVLNAMMNVPEYLNRYRELACEMLDYNFTTERLHPLINHNADLIRDFIPSDPLIDFTQAEFDIETQVLRDLIVSRRADIQGDLDDLNFICEDLAPPVSPLDIVINEFMASNDSTSNITDLAGGYPDWVEFHNNTNTDVDLDNFYLSDDIDFLKHWSFPPNTIIPANDYLIVWIDRDVDEDGLHADFKLNKNSGQIFLTYEDLTIIDSVSYSNQTTNISSSRVPNGTGPFIQQNTTFGTENITLGTNTDTPQLLDIQVFPNPANDVINIIFKNNSTQNTEIRLIDLFGKTLLQKQISSKEFQLDITNFSSGLYVLEISSTDFYLSKKIILQQ